MLLLVDVKQTGRRFKSWVSVFGSLCAPVFALLHSQDSQLDIHLPILSFILGSFFRRTSVEQTCYCLIKVMVMADRRNTS